MRLAWRPAQTNYIENGQKRWVTTALSLYALGGSWSAVRAVPDADLAAVPDGPDIGAMFPDGTFLKGSGPEIYRIEGQQRRWVPNPQTLVALGGDGKWITIDDIALAEIPEGSPVPSVGPRGEEKRDVNTPGATTPTATAPAAATPTTTPTTTTRTATAATTTPTAPTRTATAPVATTPTVTTPTAVPSGVVKAVVNASGGVYWRGNPPNWNNPIRKLGYGVYNGDTVRLECWTTGSIVPPYKNNSLWYKAHIVSGKGKGEGFVNDHFLNTGINQPNVVVPGVAKCGARPSPPPGGGSVYYAPNDGTKPANSPATVTLAAESGEFNLWVSKQCGADQAGNFSDKPNKRITTLAGWSKGRLGPTYFLWANPERRSAINYILLFDPGTYDNYKNGACDKKYNQSQLLADWLRLNPQNRLAILAGRDTADYQHRINRHGHAGIQNYLFPAIRGEPIAEQVVVCNYDDMEHEDVFRNFAEKMNEPPITLGNCPPALGYTNIVSWHP